MRNIQSTIRNFGTKIFGQGVQMIIRRESLRSLRAISMHALHGCLSRLSSVMRDTRWHGLTAWHSDAKRSAYCFAVAKQPQRNSVVRVTLTRRVG